MRIVVAMSGGVDSSTAAGLLVEAGHEVIGLAMKTHGLEPRANRACCTPDDMRDARHVAELLNIPFYVLNYEDVFRDEVIIPFAQAYRSGRTPNPCVECNDKVKFRPLLARAQLLEADYLATGHYARIAKTDAGLALQRAIDPRKDQSYFLYRLDQTQLRQLMFPLGDMTKDVVREHARRLGLPVADKSESQEICFVGAEGYAATVDKLGMGGPAGQVVDDAGKVLSQHSGIHHFTLGQRRGLRIAAPEPLYVTDIDPQGTVRVGGREALLTTEIELENTVWNGPPPAPDEVIMVQQRYRETPQAVQVVAISGAHASLRFPQPTVRGAPGQAAVLFRQDVVLGGGAIALSSTRREPVETSAMVGA